MSVRLMLVRQLESKVSSRVADRMPEVEHPMRTAAQKARAVNHVGFALDQGLEQVGIVVGVVFQIGILNEDKISGCFLYAAAQGRALAHIFRLQQNSEVGVLALQFGQNLPGAVARTIVHANQFHFLRDRQHAFYNQCAECCARCRPA